MTLCTRGSTRPNKQYLGSGGITTCVYVAISCNTSGQYVAITGQVQKIWKKVIRLICAAPTGWRSKRADLVEPMRDEIGPVQDV